MRDRSSTKPDPVRIGRRGNVDEDVRQKLIAGTHKIAVDRYNGTATLERTGVKAESATEGHSEEDIEAVCREIYGDGWVNAPYWYVIHVRQQAIRVLDWILIREYL